jgi:hypothetical protein
MSNLGTRHKKGKKENVMKICSSTTTAEGNK